MIKKIISILKQNNKEFIIVICVIVFTIPFGLYLVVFHNGLSDDYNSWGSFGSYIGGLISPMFSFASFLAVLYSFDISKKERIKDKEEKILFQYLEMLQDAHNNISCSMGENKKFKGQDLIMAYGASFANIAIACDKYKKQGIAVGDIPETPEYNGNCTNHLFFTKSIESFMNLIKLSYEHILKSKALDKCHSLELLSSVLTNQDKMAFMYYHNNYLEENLIIQKYIYDDDKQKNGIKNMLNCTTEYLQKFFQKK